MKDLDYSISCTLDEFKKINSVTNNSVATAIIMLGRTFESQLFWDHFGHETCLAIRAAIFGYGADASSSIKDLMFYQETE